MIYVLRSGDYVKIGYSNDISNRLNSYRTHNPDFILERLYDGCTSLEAHIHCSLVDLRYRTEWFYYVDGILDRIDLLVSSYNGVVSMGFPDDFLFIFPDYLSSISGSMSVSDLRYAKALCYMERDDVNCLINSDGSYMDTSGLMIELCLSKTRFYSFYKLSLSLGILSSVRDVIDRRVVKRIMLNPFISRKNKKVPAECLKYFEDLSKKNRLI